MDSQKCLFVELQSWEAERLRKRLGESCPARFSTHTLQEEKLEEGRGIEVLSPFIHSRVDQAALDRLPDLALVATRSTGVDHIDLEACRQRGIRVCNVPYYGTNTVAEHTFALMLSLTRKVHKAYEQTVHGRFSIEGLRGIDLRGRTLGVVGTGAIGTHVIRIALGFQMRVVAFDHKPIHQLANALGFEYVDLDTLLGQADIVTLHSSYTPETHHLIDEKAIARMRDGALLINTARGALVDTEALIAGLRSGKLGGAGLDVLEEEAAIMEEGEMLASSYDTRSLLTLVGNTILLRMDNVIITPHIAFNSNEALDKILDTTLKNIEAHQAGVPQNEVTR